MSVIAGGAGARRTKPCQGGWMLAEVMVAVLIAGVAVTFLAASVLSAAQQAGHVRQQAEAVGAQAAAPEVLSAWTWGAGVLAAEWSPGPVLRVQARVESGGSDPMMMGLWMDGWFQGEWPLDDSGTQVFEQGSWDGCEGAEAVLRVRAAGDAWGSPWRSLVPGPTGVVSLPPMITGRGAASVLAASSEVTSVHVPVAGAGVVETSWAPSAHEDAAHGPLVLTNPAPGAAGVAFQNMTQSWYLQSGRALDVYF